VTIDAHSRTGDLTLDQVFTPFWAAEELVADALAGLGRVHVAEPFCGTGAFLAAIPAACPAFGVDIDPKAAAVARATSGRDVIEGDFLTVDLTGRKIELLLGNPPFDMALLDALLDRAHVLLPEDGLVAMILPAYTFQTPSRVARYMERFAIDVNLIPRTLFPGLSKPLTWAKFTKTGRRYVAGLMLFAEKRDVDGMRDELRDALSRPGTWREAVSIALRELGGAAPVQDIYEAIVPERRCSPHWRPKIRQTLQRHFTSLGGGRWGAPRLLQEMIG
jgi:site-specific DNA-methyltransferase (adenine-specific)